MENTSISGKRKARRLALQALYQWQMSGDEIYEIETQFRVINDITKVDMDYFCKILHGVPQYLDSIQQAFSPFLDRTIAELNPVELAVLRLSTFELYHCMEIPYKVVLDESVMLAKTFGSQDGFRYVNGVLNHVARQARAIEIDMEK